MEVLARHPKVVGYGEIGLDFFRNLSPHDTQIGVFRDQLTLAKRLEKPVVIHLRDAYSRGLDMLEDAAPFPHGGVIHCFSGNEDDAKRALRLGFYISIPGTVTYKKNGKLRDIVKELPPDRILLETDCPFLSPEPLRGRDNEPANIVHTARKVARGSQCPVERDCPRHHGERLPAVRSPGCALRCPVHEAFRRSILRNRYSENPGSPCAEGGRTYRQGEQSGCPRARTGP